MTLNSAAQANPKTAEFARLFDLFDHVATRCTRADLTGDINEVISADDIANVPAEFAPVLKNLSAILSLRAMRHEEHVRRAKTASTTSEARDDSIVTNRPSTTVTTINRIPHVETGESSEEAKEGANRPAFPLGERYPFTFKLMLHKLYNLDEWAEKVKNAVETSRSQFKPLAEHTQSEVNSNLTVDIQESMKKRSSLRPVLGGSAKFKPPSTTCPHPAGVSSKPETSHVLKKRCIGRRKSIDGPMSSGVWVYDAAVSATEVTGPRPAVEITLSTRKVARGVVESRARHHSMTSWEEMQIRGVGKHEVKIAVPLLKEEASGSVSERPPLLQSGKPGQEVIRTENAVKRPRSVVTAFASESCKTAIVKRPSCVRNPQTKTKYLTRNMEA